MVESEVGRTEILLNAMDGNASSSDPAGFEINNTKLQGGRVIAVGPTVLRALDLLNYRDIEQHKLGIPILPLKTLQAQAFHT